ncbi:hypothetical protein H8S10_14980 [Clostridium sp. NSJ-49]|uniref:hypothetical protein n=1 Tax=Clostridium TaxID=1485 RepID=UPI00164ACAF9|nr:hypothetical protein [Clostridium sp. NSJ-49]MBC5626744.1 hypothetical protein [Clostridium sp. NSJ-49]
MNRAERRARDKEKKKDNNKKVEAMAWFRSLPPAKQTLIDSLVKIEASKETDNIYQAIDRCFSAAIFQEFDFLEYEEVTRAIDLSAELMIDDAHKIKDLKEKFGGSYDMAIKKINEMGPKVEARIRELIKEGYNQKSTIKTISEEFKDLSTAMITNSYKKTKALVREEEKLKKVAEREDVSDKRKDITEEVDKEIEDALEYIFEEDTKETKNKAHTEEKEVGQVNTSKIDEKITTKENNKDKKASKLKVIKEVTKVVERYIQGECGLYNVKGSVVTVDEEFAFSNVEDVKGWASSEREDLLKQIAEIKSKINHINSCELEAIEVIETYM